MLDWPHLLALRAVQKRGEATDSPALRNLVATGLVEPGADKTYAVTQAGRAALAARAASSRSSRLERLAWPALLLCSALLLVATVVRWVT